MSSGSFFAIMRDVDSCLLGSIGQAASDAQALQVWTTSDMDKSNGWLTGTTGSNVDPERDPDQQQIANELDYSAGPDGPAPLGATPATISAWMNTNCGFANISSW